MGIQCRRRRVRRGEPGGDEPIAVAASRSYAGRDRRAGSLHPVRAGDRAARCGGCPRRGDGARARETFPWIHAKVSEQALAESIAREDALAAAVGVAPTAAGAETTPVGSEPAAAVGAEPAPVGSEPAAAVGAEPAPVGSEPAAAPHASMPTAAPLAVPPAMAVGLDQPAATALPFSRDAGSPPSPAATQPAAARSAQVRVLTSGPDAVALSIQGNQGGALRFALALDPRDASGSASAVPSRPRSTGLLLAAASPCASSSRTASGERSLRAGCRRR